MIGRILLAVVWLGAVFAGGLAVVAGLELLFVGVGDRILLGALLVMGGALLVYAFGASLLELVARRFGP